MSKSVIVVDDSKLSRMHLRGIVLRHKPDWTVLEAGDSTAMFSTLEAADVHVAIIDYNMPGLNGLDAATQLRESRPDVHIAIVTANAQDSIIAGIRDIGAAFLPKPVDEDQVARFLSSTLLPRR